MNRPVPNVRQIHYFLDVRHPVVFYKLIIIYMYNEQTNTHLIDRLLYRSLPLLRVSTRTVHAQGALTRCLLSYINVFMQFWWYFFHIRFLESLKH